MFQDPKPLRVIGIMGRSGAGKDTSCDFLQVIARNAGFKAAKISFADPIKRACSDVYCFASDVPKQAFYGTQEQKGELQEGLGNRSGREVMQFIGTGGFRAITADIWVDYLKKHAIVLAKYGSDLVIVSDVRFENEAATIWDMGGTIVRIVRDSADGSTHVGIPNHPSELEQDSIDADVEISNNGTLEELRHALRSLL